MKNLNTSPEIIDKFIDVLEKGGPSLKNEDRFRMLEDLYLYRYANKITKQKSSRGDMLININNIERLAKLMYTLKENTQFRDDLRNELTNSINRLRDQILGN